MTDYIQLLIEKGAEQNSMFHNKSSTQGPRIDEKDNVSILMYACIYADIRLIDLIVTEKNINLKDKNGKNALFYVLYDKGDNTDVLDALLYHQIDFDCVGRIDMGDKNFENHTPLSLAASKNMIHSFKILIDKGANPNIADKNGSNPLHFAAQKGNINSIRMIIDKGANPNVVDEFDYTPLHWAARNGNAECVQVLVDKGADPNLANKEGSTPLHWAAYHGKTDCVRILVEKGANPSIVNEDGLTPLDYAIANDKFGCIELLMSKGSPSKDGNKAGYIPVA